MFENSPPRTTLDDRANLKEYSVISDVGLTWAADSIRTSTANHESIIWCGLYAAPEDGNNRLDIRVIDSMAEVTDVPETR